MLGDGPTAAALVARLECSGVAIHSLPTGDIDDVLARLEQIVAAGPAPHLFITTARDAADADPRDEHAWEMATRDALLLPYFVCQKWLQLAAAGKWIDRASLVGVVDLGGDFGFARGACSPLGGGVAGLLKAILIEYVVVQQHSKLRVKVIDAPTETSDDELMTQVLRELASGNPACEVAYVGSRRLVPMAIQHETAAVDGSPIRPGGVWVVTGGARGIGAACALELGRRFGLKLHLLGTTPLPQIDPAWRDLDEQGTNALRASLMIAARQAGEPAAARWERVQKDIEIDRSLRLCRGRRRGHISRLRRFRPRGSRTDAGSDSP